MVAEIAAYGGCGRIGRFSTIEVRGVRGCSTNALSLVRFGGGSRTDSNISSAVGASKLSNKLSSVLPL